MNRNVTAILLIVLTALCCLFSHSCANTKAAPSGGPKDTIPPVLIKIDPEQNTRNMPLADVKIALTYNEYTVVKEASGVYLSPPTKHAPSVKVKGKSILVTLRDTLAENTTYTIDFNNALADNNEGNLAPRFTYTFSTGDSIDSMYLTGTVLDCQKLTPVKGVLVALYEDLSDSACMVSLPAAAGRTDDWGFFVIRNIKPRPYRIYAYSDDDKDNLYLQGEDFIAFNDSLFTPELIVRDSIYELGTFNMKDTVACEMRKSEVSLLLFKETASRQFIKNKGRKDNKRGFLRFNAQNTVLNSFQIFGVDSTAITKHFSPEMDSMDFWIDTPYPLPDSLLLSVEYLKTDSLGNLVMTKEDVAISMTDEEKAALNSDQAKADTLIRADYECKNENVEQDGITIRFPDPVSRFSTDSILFIATNPKNQNDTISFSFEKDEHEFETYHLQSSQPYQTGYKYQVIFKKNAFYDIYGRKNKENVIDIELPNTDKTGSITLNVKGIKESNYIIELVSSDMKQVYRKFNTDKDTKLYFPYLNAGKYTFRITEDRNRNGIFDTGNLLERKQPEKVIVFKLPDGNGIIELPEQTDIEQDLQL
ncbi:MAG: Ig-like domain-containing protein [Bacteroidales bacterium]|nr:Ig-like domain-containing protein [Bacteroidales bacterium]